MSFEEAFREVVMVEGGYVDHPADHGGETKYGISKRWHPGLDIPNLTLKQAKEIYRAEYWDRLSLDRIGSDLISHEMFDTAVNMGLDDAAYCAQEAVNLLSPGRLKVDGAVGPKTVGAINDMASRALYPLFKAMNGFQFIRYVNLVEEDPSQQAFIKGWMKRIQDARR